MPTIEIDEASYQGLLEENRQLRRHLEALLAVQENAHQSHTELLVKNAILSSSICATAIADIQGHLTYVNQAFLDLLGYEHAPEVLGKSAASFWQRPDEINVVIGALQEKGEWSGEMLGQKKNGDVARMEFKAILCKDSAGNPVALEASFLDITERKVAEASLRQSLELFKSVVHNSADLTILADAKGVTTYISPQCESITGYPGEFFLGKTMSAIIHPDDQARSREAWEHAALRGQPPRDFEYRIIDSQGAIRWLVHKAKMIRVDGRFLGVQSNIRDITAQKRADEELEQACLRAEEANRAKDQFLANVSYEVRTPLSGIIGMTELLHGTALSQEQREYVKDLQTSGKLLLNVVNDILDFSRFQAEKLTIEQVDFDLTTVIQEVISNLTPVAKEKKLALPWSIAPEVPPRVSGDPVRLKRVLLNLAGNGIKFTEQGSLSVDLFLEKEQENEVWVRFQLEDTGIGIERDQAEKLFQPFAQVDGSTTRKYRGTGLGLVICKELVEMMGGCISFESIPGAGSRFLVTVPFRKAASAERSLAETPASTRPAGSELPAARLRVLVAEDDLVSRRMMVRFFEKLGHDADAVVNGCEALTSLRRSSYDLLLMDCQMPEMDGYEATQRIRAGDAGAVNANLPIIALTASAMDGDRARCLEVGMNDHLSKPISLSELTEVLDRWASVAKPSKLA